MIWSDAMIHANGIDIHYWRSGGDKPAMLLSHGLTDSGRCWESIVADLAPDYDVIAPDARGHGRSSVPESGYQSADRVADLLGLLDALGLERVVALGHSMGGDATALLAATAPQRVRAAILEDPPFWSDGSVSGPQIAAEWAAGLQADKALGKAGLLTKARTELTRWDPTTFDAWSDAKLQANERVFSWLVDRPNNWREILPTITVPTLLITADPALGAIITPAIAAAFADACPGGQVVQISDAGHCIRYEQRVAYLAAVRAFLADVR